MNHDFRTYLFLVTSTCIALHLSATPITLEDTIVAIVSSAGGTEIITQSDLDRPTLFGQYRSLSDCEFGKAILLEAKKHKIDVDDAMVEGYLESVQQAYHLTRQDINQMFIDAGYTVSEGIEQLRESQIMNIILQREVYEHISISLQEVRAYYDMHPTCKQTEYVVERALVGQKTIGDVAAQPEHLLFSAPIVLQESEISSDHVFILHMKSGEMHYNTLSDGTIEVIRLQSRTDSRLLSFDERYDEIAPMLQKEKYETLFSQFKQRLLQSVSIVHL